MIAVNDEFIQKNTGRRYVVRTVRESDSKGLYFLKFNWHTQGGTVYRIQQPHIIDDKDTTIHGYIPV